MPIKPLPTNALSIVVPVGPGDRSWRDLLPCLDGLTVPFEVVLSACETTPADLIPEGAPLGVSWLDGEAGRPTQLNRGIQAARANQLWILHADARPSPEVLKSASEPIEPDVLGWFPLEFDPPDPPLIRLNALGANLRSRWLGLPFGDQGWRLTRTTLDRLGGFDPHWARGEDLEFVVRARREGIRLHRFPAALATSPRRYAERGWWPTTREHLRLTRTMWRDARRGRGR